MSKLNISRLTNENEDGAPKISGISTFSSTAFFDPPKGTTAQSAEFVQPGMIRFNTDGGHLEYYNGVEWTEVLVANNTLDGGNRGLFGGGRNLSGSQNTIDYVTISTLSNALDFGDLSAIRTHISSSSSSTRGIWAGGYDPGGGDKNIIHYITITSTGNAQDFGDLTVARFGLGGCSSNTRAVLGGGYGNSPLTQVNTIDYITISSNGTNAQDFGDLTQVRAGVGACSSSTRGLFAGGYTPTVTNTMDYIIISTTGNASDFGDLTQARAFSGGCSNSTRGVFSGGWDPSFTNTNTIDFITIASTGNAADFGDLTRTANQPAACSSATRGVFGGGTNTDNTIDYITILTTGNAVDFGDLTQGRRNAAACSNGHGGL